MSRSLIYFNHTVQTIWKIFREASRQSSVGDTSNTEKDDTFDLELEKLKEEQKKAEERRRLEDEAIQEKLRELERRKREKEEQERQVCVRLSFLHLRFVREHSLLYIASILYWWTVSQFQPKI